MAEQTYTVQRSILVEAPPDRIYDEVADFRRWTAWSPWEDVDPDLRRSYEGSDSGVGSVYRWSGNRKAGQGRMEIVETAFPSLVRIDLAFEKPWKARNDTRFEIELEGGISRVTWSMSGHNTLMTRVMGIFTSMDKLIGPDFEKGLARLKQTVEASAPG